MTSCNLLDCRRTPSVIIADDKDPRIVIIFLIKIIPDESEITLSKIFATGDGNFQKKY